MIFKKVFQTILCIITWNFTKFLYMSHVPQVKQNLILRTINLIYKLPYELPNELNFGHKEIRKCQQNLKIAWEYNLVCRVSFRNKFLPLALKKHSRTDTKISQSSLNFLDSLIFPKVFCKRLSLERSATYDSHQSPSNFKIF